MPMSEPVYGDDQRGFLEVFAFVRRDCTAASLSAWSTLFIIKRIICLVSVLSSERIHLDPLQPSAFFFFFFLYLSFCLSFLSLFLFWNSIHCYSLKMPVHLNAHSLEYKHTHTRALTHAHTYARTHARTWEPECVWNSSAFTGGTVSKGRRQRQSLSHATFLTTGVTAPTTRKREITPPGCNTPPVSLLFSHIRREATRFDHATSLTG